LIFAYRYGILYLLGGTLKKVKPPEADWIMVIGRGGET